MGKGSKRRPTDEARYGSEYERIFGRKESIMTGASVLRRPRNENPQNLKEGVYFYEPHRGANVLRSYKYAYEHACEERDRQSRYLESQRDLNVWLEIRNEDLLREIKALKAELEDSK